MKHITRPLNATSPPGARSRAAPTNIRRALLGASATLGALALVAAGASSATAAAKPAASPRAILKWAGVGDKASAHVLLPKNWTITWRFSCVGAKREKPFAMAAASQSPRHRIQIIAQDGLGGGGQKTYTSAGTFVFSVTTGCNWNLDVVSGVPKRA
jgi:hypothetical protein